MKGLDCLVIGYYEPPFEEYESLIRRFGERSQAYRDLRLSTATLAGRKRDYVGLLNQAYTTAAAHAPAESPRPMFLSGDIPNLAAVYLCAYLRKRGFSAEYINLPAFEREALSEYLAGDLVCIAITTTFYLYNQPVKAIIHQIRECNQSVKIVVGGPLIANHFRQHSPIPGEPEDGQNRVANVLRDIDADAYVIESQGEATLARLLTSFKSRQSLVNVPNVAYFDDERLIVTDRVPENNVLDENVVDWGQWPIEDLGATIQTRTARSCAFKCAFCNYPTRAGALALASVNAVSRELDSIERLGTIKNVVFIDDTFNVPLPRFKALCRMMIDRGYPMRWFSYLRCSNVDRETVELMAKSGCLGVFLGIESGSDAILKNMNKAATADKYAWGIQMLREHGIMTFASFIVGFPGETSDTVDATYEFVEQNRPDYFRAQLWYCEPGTPIMDARDTFGIAGQGFTWRHNTMCSEEAIDHVEHLFRRVSGSVWLPQWSFDFWIIPYLVGRGLTLAQFREFMTAANGLLACDLAETGGRETVAARRQYEAALVNDALRWSIERR